MMFWHRKMELRHLLVRRAVPTFLIVAMVVTAVRADPLQEGFQDPPASARPQTWWHWMNGNITREGITADLEAMKRVGLGGAEIFNVDCGIPPGPVKFMSPEWRALMVYAAKEAHRLGLELCIHNCAGWSSSGGPWNTPEHAMQEITTSEQTVTGPTHFSGVLPSPPRKLDYYRDISVLAFRGATPQGGEVKGGAAIDDVLFGQSRNDSASGGAIQTSNILDLTSRLQSDGRLEWDVPDGEWTILRVGYTPTGQQNHPAPAEGTGLECDKMSKEALDAHWAGFVQKVLDDVSPLAGKGKTLDGVLIDSYEVGPQDWTPRFREEFRKRRGYDLQPYLPALTGRIVESPEVTRRFLRDWRLTVSDLFAENYYGHFQELCHERGLQASIEPYSGPFDPLKSGGKADIPMGEFWVGSSPGLIPKLAASVGHTYGQQIIGAEAFTAAPSARHGRWLDDAYSLKALGDLVFCEGVNRMILHRYAMQPWTNRWPGMTMGQWGTHFDRTCTWWEQGRAWLQYLARCQFLLQQGKFVADLAYFVGEMPGDYSDIGDSAPPAGYDVDGVDAEVLLHRASMKNGRLTLDSGVSYAVLVLPSTTSTMSPELLNRLAGFVGEGLTLVGRPPQSSPSLKDYPECDTEVKRLAAELWGDCDGKTVTEHGLGKGKVVWGEPLIQVLNSLNLSPDFEFSHSGGSRLAFIHRREGNDEIYFVSNQQARYDSVECRFRVHGRAPELWYPDNGTIRPAPVWREENDETVVPLSFDPAGSVFVVFRQQAQGDHLVSVQAESRTAAEKRSKPAELQILKAVYGAYPKLLDLTAEVKSMVAKGELRIPASNDFAGDDPAFGRVKRMRIDFLLGGQRHVAEASEGDTLTLPAGCQVVRAVYGDLPAVGPNWLDVTATVKSLVSSGTRQILATNALVGKDPAPNVVKKLRIEFLLDGEKQTREANEGQTLDLPEGAIVQNAVYGSLDHSVAETEPGSVDLTARLAGLVSEGELNVTIDNALAGGDPAFGFPKELRVEYSLNGVVKHTTVAEGDALILPATGQPAGTPPPFDFTETPDGRTGIRARIPGTFDLTWASGRKSQVQCSQVPKPQELAGPWEVRFPPGWGAPEQALFEHLQSWTENANPGVKYFSGTATYLREIHVPSGLLGANHELWLDLGAVKNFAEVSVNGRSFGVLWKPPFRVDITAAVKPGANALEIKITNLWPNRLIGDEQLPADCEWRGKELRSWPQWLLQGKPSPTGRHTFTTWHHWTKDDDLLESGLLGPVTLQSAEERVVQ